MKYSCGHKADPLLPRAAVMVQKWCVACDPQLRAQREKAENEARLRNRRTQRDLDRIGMGKYGPNPDQEHITWKPTPEQFLNTVRVLGGLVSPPTEKDDAP